MKMLFLFLVSLFFVSCFNSGSSGGGSTGGSSATPGISISLSWFLPTGLEDNISPNGESVPTSGADKVSVSTSENGDAMIVWLQGNGITNKLYMSHYQAGAWTHPIDLNDFISVNGGGDVIGFKVAMDDDGNGLIAWSQVVGGIYQVFKREYKNGVWIVPTNASDNISPDGQNAFVTSLAMDDNSNALILWEQSDGVNSQIFKSEFRNNNWTHPINLSDNISSNGQSASGPKVVMDNLGNSLIVWYQLDGTNPQLFKSEFRNGSWIHPINLADHFTSDYVDIYEYAVGIDNQGNAVISWISDNSTNLMLYKSEYRNSTWIHPSNTTAGAISLLGYDVLFMDLAMISNGHTVIAYTLFDGVEDHLYQCEFINSWSCATQLSNRLSIVGSSVFDHPRISLDTSGYGGITWGQQNSGAVFSIYKAERKNSVWVSPTTLSDTLSSSLGTSLYPEIAVGAGGAIIVWVAQDSNVNVQVFKANLK